MGYNKLTNETKSTRNSTKSTAYIVFNERKLVDLVAVCVCVSKALELNELALLSSFPPAFKSSNIHVMLVCAQLPIYKYLETEWERGELKKKLH